MVVMRESWTDERLDEFAKRVDERFDRVDERFDEVDKRFEQVDKRFEQVDKRFEALEQRLLHIDGRLDRMAHAMMVGSIAISSTMIAGFGIVIGVLATQM